MYFRCSQTSPSRRGLLLEPAYEKRRTLRKPIKYVENDSGKKLLQLLCLALLTPYTQTSHFTSCDFHMSSLEDCLVTENSECQYSGYC